MTSNPLTEHWMMARDRRSEHENWWDSHSPHWTRTGSVAGGVGAVLALVGLFVTVFIWLDEKPKNPTAQDVHTPVSSESSTRESPPVDEAKLEAVNADDDQWSDDITIPLRAYVCLRATYVNNGPSSQEVRMRLEGVEDLLFSDGSVCTAKFAIPEANFADLLGNDTAVLGTAPPRGSLSVVLALTPNVDLDWSCETRPLAPKATFTVNGRSASALVAVRVRRNCG